MCSNLSFSAIRNPGTFYYTDYTTNVGDWTSPQNDALWRDGEKTLFDPCPAGWRVPKNGSNDLCLWLFFCVEGLGKGTPNAVTNSYVFGTAGGYHFYCDEALATTSWYPAAGSRYGSTAGLVQVGNYGHARSSTVSSSLTTFFLTLTTSQVYPYDGALKTVANASATSVRCIRE